MTLLYLLCDSGLIAFLSEPPFSPYNKAKNKIFVHFPYVSLHWNGAVLNPSGVWRPGALFAPAKVSRAGPATTKGRFPPPRPLVEKVSQTLHLVLLLVSTFALNES